MAHGVQHELRKALCWDVMCCSLQCERTAHELIGYSIDLDVTVAELLITLIGYGV